MYQNMKIRIDFYIFMGFIFIKDNRDVDLQSLLLGSTVHKTKNWDEKNWFAYKSYL